MEDNTEQQKAKISPKVVFKSGMWYVISTFLFRAIAFFTTPVIARVLTKGQYGYFNNMKSWVGFIGIATACDLDTSIVRAKLDFEEDLDSYSLSVMTLQSVLTLAIFAVFTIFSGPISSFMEIDAKYFPIIFANLLFSQCYAVYITNERANYRYKTYSITTGVMISAYSILSVILVLNMENKLDAVVIGNYLPYIIVGAIFAILIIKRGKRIKFHYFKYALMISLPLVPHVLSLILLQSSDRIMITKLQGETYTALYSLSSIIPNIVAVLLSSMNQAWAPWFLDTMKVGDRKTIYRVASLYFGLFLILTTGVLLLTPEAVYILGGKKYLAGIYVAPPLIVGTVLQFAYSMYVQVEFYEKKMRTVAFATAIAAAVNIGLNFILIPIFGYAAAGYTTLAGYMALFLLHYRTICKFGYKNIFNRKVIFGGLLLSIALIPVIIWLYGHRFIRYGVVVAYMILLICVFYKNREYVKRFIKLK